MAAINRAIERLHPLPLIVVGFLRNVARRKKTVFVIGAALSFFPTIDSVENEELFSSAHFYGKKSSIRDRGQRAQSLI